MDGLTTRQLDNRRDRRPERKLGLLQAGTMLQDRYRIVETLGVGGFSSVYKARDMHFPSVTRLCAVKEMVHSSRDPEARQLATQSFEREASILATLDHPAVPDVYDYFSEGDRSYLVLEYIHGRDLEALLSEGSTFIPIASVVDWAVQLCDVLDYLHNHKPQPVVFRDLKPSNIMLDRHNRIRLIDFNIAKLFQTGMKGTMIGTEGYSPPEQYRGEARPAGDIYALGATVHHLLTRRDPRTEPPFSFSERPIEAVNPDVPESFQKIIERCLAYHISDRYQRASDLRQAIITMPEYQRLMQLRYGNAGQTLTSQAPSTTSPAASVNVNVGDTPSTSLLWTFRCEDEIRSTPAVDSGVVYVGAYDNNLYAIKADTGAYIWKHASSDGIASSPFVYRDTIYIGSTDSHLFSIKRNGGKLNWKFETGGPIYSSPKADFDHIFVGSDDGYLYAVSMSGRQVWRTNAHSAIRSTACIGENRIYFGTEDGYVFCLNLSGRIKWQFRAKRSVTSSPALAEDMIIVGSMDASVYAIDASSGWALWRFRTRRPVVSSPLVVEDTLYIGSSDGYLYALDLFSGRQRWHFKVDGQINSSPASWEDDIYFGATDGAVYCVDRKRGKLRWRYDTGAMVVSSPVIDQGIVYVGSCNHHLYALTV